MKIFQLISNVSTASCLLKPVTQYGCGQHYCSVDLVEDPTAQSKSIFWQSGLHEPVDTFGCKHHYYLCGHCWRSPTSVGMNLLPGYTVWPCVLTNCGQHYWDCELLKILQLIRNAPPVRLICATRLFSLFVTITIVFLWTSLKMLQLIRNVCSASWSCRILLPSLIVAINVVFVKFWKTLSSFEMYYRPLFCTIL